MAHDGTDYSFSDSDAPGRVGARLRQHVDGHCVEDDSQPAAAVPVHGVGEQRLRRRAARGPSGVNGARREGLLGRAERLPRPTQGYRRGGLWAGCRQQAAVCDGHQFRARRDRSPARPRRQGHPGRAAGCLGRRPYAQSHARRSLRSAAITGHGRRISWATDRGGADAAVVQRLSCGVLGGDRPGVCGRCSALPWHPRAKVGPFPGYEEPDSA